MPSQEIKKNTTKIEVQREVQELLKLYCVFNNTKMVDYVSQLIERELAEFKTNVETWKASEQNQ